MNIASPIRSQACRDDSDDNQNTAYDSDWCHGFFHENPSADCSGEWIQPEHDTGCLRAYFFLSNRLQREAEAGADQSEHEQHHPLRAGLRQMRSLKYKSCEQGSNADESDMNDSDAEGVVPSRTAIIEDDCAGKGERCNAAEKLTETKALDSAAQGNHADADACNRTT